MKGEELRVHDKRVSLFLICALWAAVWLVGCRSGGTPTTAAIWTLVPTHTQTALAVPLDTPLPSQTAPATIEPSLTPVSTSTPYLSPAPNPTTPPAATLTPFPLSTFTSEPDATATPVPDAEPIILYFQADVQQADPGDTISLEWASQGADDAILYHMPASGQMPAAGWDVSTTGVLSYDIQPEERNRSEFLLVVTDQAGRHANAQLVVKLRCPDPWFFTPEPDVCPTTPIVSSAAEQHFERGTMIWVAEEDRIYVLYDDAQHSPKWDAFADEWGESKPDHDPSLVPPQGLFQPVRGFGLAWREYPGVRDRLGWATDKEAAFDTTVQRTTLYKYNSVYVRGLDGRVWHLGPERSSWEVVP